MNDKELDDLEARLRRVTEDRETPPSFYLLARLFEEAADAIAELRKKNAGLVGAMQEALEYFDDRMDADQPSGSAPIPNDEMRLFIMLDAALEENTQ